MAELRNLKQRRSTIKGQLTRMNNALTDETTAVEVQVRQEKIEELWQKFEDIQTAIDNHRVNAIVPGEGEEEAANEIMQQAETEREVFEGIYYEASAKMHRIIHAAQQQQQLQQQQLNGEGGTANKMDIKLPTLKLPEFKGEYNEWLLFKDTYSSLIHNNTSITAIQKFQYLRSALKGEALQIIGGLETSAENYANAWELLTKNYDNNKFLINTHLSKLLDFPTVAKDKPATIRQLIVHIRTHSKALKTLGLPVDQWDELLIHLMKTKFDYSTQKDWEEEANRNGDTRKTLEEYFTFLTERCCTFEMLEKFLQLAVAERIQEVKAKKLCINCLGKGHYATNCKASTCKKCEKKHNTLLHLDSGERSSTTRESSEESEKKVVAHCSSSAPIEAARVTSSSTNFVRGPTAHVILSTARIQVKDANGTLQNCRVLLDPGSQSNLVTEEFVRKLKLKCKDKHELISGVNKAQTIVARTVELEIRSMHADYKTSIECLVLRSITEKLPQVRINTSLMYLPKGIQLADPQFHEPGTVDLLLGAGLFWHLLCPDMIYQPKGLPRLQHTLLGCIVGGELVDTKDRKPAKFCGLVTNTALQSQLERFWNQEETHETRRLTQEEADCERQFCETAKRDTDGRFIVALPVKSDVKLGDSRTQATRRLYSLERRFKGNPELKSAYIKFLEEYVDQGHMSLISDESLEVSGEMYTIPHQPLIRPDSITTKLRVVFDASAKTSSGASLNDKLLAGPNLQKDLFEIILRFRAHEIVITADIAAMFRQIVVREEDRDLQRILWRTSQTEPIQTYRLNTVTYGTASAPYLAMRCLRQLASEEKEFRRAARVLEYDFYMDDVLTGARTIEDAMALQQELSLLLRQGQFHLRKWRSSNDRVLANLSENNEADGLLKIEKEGPLKTLGLHWDAKSDTLQYSVTLEKASKVTKRLVLSKIAQIFDPLGLLGPVIINAKCIMQQLWQTKSGWDEPLPPELQILWNQYYYSLPKINEVRIPRNINKGNINEGFDLIGFGDASEKAYGACLYAVSKSSDGKVSSELISSKGRVAPLKAVSLPRLELNAALLLAKLCATAQRAYGEKIRSVHLWSDSTITLSWIATSSNILKTYVANRVSKIQDLTRSAVWRHVPSKDNPADLISRGITVEDWRSSDLWWHGHTWLTTGKWPEPRQIDIDMSEMKPQSVLLSAKNAFDILRKYSSHEKLQRTIAYLLRFKANALGGKQSGPLSVEELDLADKSIAKMTQRECFESELLALENGQQVHKGSKLAPLSPFLDGEGVIRVGGRLSRANIPEAQKHPVLLPAKHHVTKIIMKSEHIRLHHCGPEQLLCSLRQKYWTLSGRREARKITSSCLQCYRRNPRTPEVIMGNLPSERVRGSLKPFTNAGVDYAGPLQVRESRRRGRIHVSKAWIAVFVCLATKAVHLELVTELTTESFLAALRRFTARRGVCTQMVSDNGTNFVGAARELREVYDFLAKEQTFITNNLARQKIEWPFIPPRAPHFGGLWEAAVKATKRHLNTVTKGLVSTFEEYYTLLVEIESILNSRPLTPLSSDPNDMTALTPAHFLVGDTLLLPVEHNYVDVKDHRLSRWQHLQKVRQHFWNRWHNEYLQELQKRQKWFSKGENLEIGTLVLLKDDNVPPLHWHLGRIAEVHPGADKVVRVATVKTPSGLLKRAVKNLCPLPIEEEADPAHTA